MSSSTVSVGARNIGGFRRRRTAGSLFDAAWYLAQHPDVLEARADPLTHYCRHGWREGRNPCPLFDVTWYLTRHPDVAAAGVEPLAHYREAGWREGRSPSPLFDVGWYLAQHPDVAQAGVEPLAHYRETGWREGRRPNPLFDVGWYLAQHPDVAQAGVEPLAHYRETGWREGRRPNPLFDVGWYLAQHPDVAQAGLEPLAHYCEAGWREGRSPNPLFDVRWYLTQHPDVAEAGVEPLAHYRETGWREGRNPNPLFDVRWYLTQHPDVAEAGIEPLAHYRETGWREGRNPNPLFDVRWYLAQHRDVAQAGLEPLTHYRSAGWGEGRSPGPLFDGAWYLEKNPDVMQAGLDPLSHYLLAGWKERRLAAPGFNSLYYLDTNDDVRRLGVNPLYHFVTVGRDEGRSASPPSPIDLTPATLAPPARIRSHPARRRMSGGSPQYSSPLIITGVHRSGTSMTANLLHAAGLHLGDEMLGARESNPFGHFEDVEVIRFHEQLLRISGRTWQASKPFLPHVRSTDWRWLLSYAVQKSRHPAWGVKDPRICFFLPQWQRVFPSMSVLYVYRPCVESVHSIKRRAARHLSLDEGVRFNARFWSERDLAVKMYLNYAESALSFLRTFRGRWCVVPLTDLILGRDIVSEIRQQWGYQLHDVPVESVFDRESLNDARPNELLFDPSLLERIEKLEREFEVLAGRSVEPAHPLLPGPTDRVYPRSRDPEFFPLTPPGQRPAE